MHKDHIHCLFLARRYLERQGYAVLLGALQPTSDEYVSWKLQGQAMGFRNRFTACELAAMGSTDETRIDDCIMYDVYDGLTKPESARRPW